MGLNLADVRVEDSDEVAETNVFKKIDLASFGGLGVRSEL